MTLEQSPDPPVRSRPRGDPDQSIIFFCGLELGNGFGPRAGEKRANLLPVFVGHFGVGLAAKRIAPRASLGWLIAAPLLLDLVWPIFLLLGWESVRIEPGATVVTPFEFVSYPISHSLVAVAGWAAVAGIVYWAISRYARGALVIAACVGSHWFLDWVVHVPDLPLYPGGAKYGLGLWNSVAATLVVEGLFLGAGVWLYARSTMATSRAGRIGWWAFVVFIVVVYAANFLGPPPQQVEQVAFVTLSLWLMPFWAWGFDRRRAAVVRPE